VNKIPVIPGIGATVKITDSEGHTLATSKNLRGINDYSRKPGQRIEYVQAWPLPDGEGCLRVDWCNGARCIVRFASHALLLEHIKKSRTMRSATIKTHGLDSPVRAGSI